MAIGTHSDFEPVTYLWILSALGDCTANCAVGLMDRHRPRNGQSTLLIGSSTIGGGCLRPDVPISAYAVGALSEGEWAFLENQWHRFELLATISSRTKSHAYFVVTQLTRSPRETNVRVRNLAVRAFPFGLSSTGRFPIWATGFLAQELGIVTPENPTFLIDCRTRQGQSGSPVIAYRTNMITTVDGNKASTTMGAGSVAWEFLGIYSGRVNSESDLGRVWHVSAIEELLAAAEIAMPQKSS